MTRRVLDVPYRSQNDPDAQVKNNDCGAACVAMILRTQGQDVTTNDVYVASGVSEDRPLLFDEIIAASGRYGMRMTWQMGLSLQDIRAYIDQGTPVIALIKYQYLPDRQGQDTTDGHFVLVVGYDDEAGRVVINDPYYWGAQRDKGNHHPYDYGTWEQAWGRCHEDGNLNHCLLIPQGIRPVPVLPDSTPPASLPGVKTVYVLSAADHHGGLKLRPVRNTNVAGRAVFSGTPLTVVQGPVAGAGDVTWLFVRTQNSDDIAGWACVQSGGEAFIGDSPGAVTATTISPVTPTRRTVYVWPDADKYGGLKLRPVRGTAVSGPACKSGAALDVVAEPVGSGDHEWWLVVARDGNDTAGWAHVRQAGEIYMRDTPPGGGVSFAGTGERDLWVIAADGLMLRTQRDVPARLGVSPTVLFGQRVTGIGPESAVDDRGRTWQQIRRDDGLVAWAPASEGGERYLADAPPAGAAPVATPTTPTTRPAVTPSVDVRPFAKCLTGVGMANPQLLLPEELAVIAASKVEAVKVLSLPDPDDNKQLIRGLRNVQGDVFIVARLFYQIDLDNKPRFSAQNFFETTVGGVNALYQVGVRYFEVHNEPNLENEGMNWNWSSGAEFGAWFIQVLGLLRQRFPEGKFGFPGVSPQPNVPDFLDGAAPAIAQSDWVGVHCYWQSIDQPPFPMTGDNAGMYWRGLRERYPDKLLMITEFSNNNGGVDYADKGRQYARYFQLLRAEPNLGAAFAFALNWPGQDVNHEGWVYEGRTTPIAEALSALIGQPGFLA